MLDVTNKEQPTAGEIIPPARRLPPNAGKGRKKGVPNKVTADLKGMVLDALKQAGGVDYLVWLAHNEPASFTALLGRIIPLQVRGDGEQPAVVEIVHTFQSTI